MTTEVASALMFQNFEKYVNRSSIFNKVATKGLKLYYKNISVFSRFLITVQNQKRIQNPVKHLRWSGLLEIYWHLAVSYFRKTFRLRYLTGF